MRKLEEAKFHNCSFQELIAHSKKWKSEVRSMNSQAFQKMGLVRPEDNRLSLYCIASGSSNGSQSIFVADMPLELMEKYVPGNPKIEVKLKLAHNVDNLIKKGEAPSAEFALMCERQRSQVAQGINDYEICHKEMTLLAGDHVFRCHVGKQNLTPITVGFGTDSSKNEGEPMDISELSSMVAGTKGCSVEPEHSATANTSSTSTPEKKPPSSNFVSSAKLCPSNSDYCAYVLNKQVYIEKKGQILYHTTAASKYITNGVPSYIVQEEMERFDGIWWSDTHTRLLYEQVDEEGVTEAHFGVNGERPAMPMKYPRVGTKNPSSQLRMVVIENEKVYDVALDNRILQNLFPGFEYITRAGFFSDGTTVWLQAMSRTQQEAWIALIPFADFDLPPALRKEYPESKTEFELADNLNMSHFDPNVIDERPRHKLQKSIVINRQWSEHWINTHNVTCPLKIEDPENPVYEFIYCVEKSQGTILTLITAYLDKNGHNYHTEEKSLMAETYSVNKSMGIVIDENRHLVYYVANESHPTEWNVCVSSYRTDAHAQLTESGICYKAERSNGKLALDLDHGFSGWMTSVGSPSECRFYSFRWMDGKELPKAVYAGVVFLPGSPPTPEAIHDVPEMIEYQSRRTGLMHYGMIIRPANFDPNKKYPVFHYVYGGPGIQIVHNDFTWIQFIRFARLGYVVAVLDNRGSAHRGIDFEGFLSRKMGTVEVEDQVEGLQMMSEQTGGFMDMNRVVVHGWSYGGYMALQLIAKHPKVYSAAIAGGAVTDWRLYDTAYTERYMGYPVIAEQYEQSSILGLVDQLPNEPNRLMLIHGLMDENVHFSHLTSLIDECVKKGKWHELVIFPKERHGIRSNDASVYLDARMMFFAQTAIQNSVLKNEPGVSS